MVNSEEVLPNFWVNILPKLPSLLPPMKWGNGSLVKPQELERVFSKELVRQEFSTEERVPIPHPVRDALIEFGRPTPLMRARRLEEFLRTPAKIYFKYEGALPTGAHKLNTALAQAYYNASEGTSRVVTETGAGQWGTALSLAGAVFGLSVTVYMVKVSYLQKPYRKTLMMLYGAEVIPSPSGRTRVGREILEQNPNHPGSLGIAISEAMEDVLNHEDSRYCLGSVLNHVLLHQTIIGLEAKKQLELIGEHPDYVVGCVGGGSNFAGISYPFMIDVLGGMDEVKFVAVEPASIPSMSEGKYMYDFGDTAGLTPMIKMLTLGHDFTPPPIHAGGLRYHGVAPTLSLLIKEGYVEPIAYPQEEVFRAGEIFARTEGIVPAPESAHAVKAVIDIARQLKESGERRTILFNLSGHGLLDLAGYETYLKGEKPRD